VFICSSSGLRAKNETDGFFAARKTDFLCLPFQGALGEIDLITAPAADMRFVKFIRKNFFFLPAGCTLAFK